jgi:hypothetical protein
MSVGHPVLRTASASALFGLVFATSVHIAAQTATKHTLLVVLAHRDDDVSIAPLLAKYANEGHRVFYATFPGAQDPSAVEDSPERQELLCASRALGVNDTFVKAPETQGLTTTAELFAFERRVAERLIELIDQTKPDVIITWGPEGLTGHPLHITIGGVVARVFQRPELLKYRARKLYYIAYGIAVSECKALAFRNDIGGLDRCARRFHHNASKWQSILERDACRDSLSHVGQRRIQQ